MEEGSVHGRGEKRQGKKYHIDDQARGESLRIRKKSYKESQGITMKRSQRKCEIRASYVQK